VQIFLETDRLVLRRFIEDDLDNPSSSTAIPTRCTSLMAVGRPRAMRSRVDRSIRGWFHFRPARAAHPNEVELGYRLRKSVWGKGYVTEGSRDSESRRASPSLAANAWLQSRWS
jgi:hypothetical protein